ncbi:MAG: hypothetical protein J1E81_01515 [Eubacterium sp.]|nr:hypothetical protein [Eubacterium sp.]
MNTISNEDLLKRIYSQEQAEKAFQQLIINLRPMMIKIGKEHLSKIAIYDLDDYIQESSIVLWQLIQSKKFNWESKFSTLFYTAFDRKCTNLYRDYVLKNMIVLSESEDFCYYGYHATLLVEDEIARKYRERHREECRRWYEKIGRNRMLNLGQSSRRKKRKNVPGKKHVSIMKAIRNNVVRQNADGIRKIVNTP